MAEQEGTRSSGRSKSKPLNYFYLNGDLHKKLHINRGADEITAWSYPAKRRVTYPYSAVKRRMERAFTTKEAGKLLMRSGQTLELAILRGDIEPPQHTYGLNENMKKFKYMWHERDILAAHAYLSTLHRGRPRADGLVTPQRLPTVRELRALIRNSGILYVREGDTYRPVWDAEEI